MQSALTPTSLELKRRSSTSSLKEALLPGSDVSIDDDTQSIQTDEDVEEYLEWRTTMMENLRNYSKSSLEAIFQQSIDVTGDILLMHGQIIKNKERIEVSSLFPKLSPILETYRRQCQMLQELLDCQNQIEEIENVMQKYEDLGVCKITIKENGEICWNIIGFGTNYVLRNLIGQLLRITQQLFISSQVFDDSEALSAVEIQITMQKIAAVSEFLPYAAEFDTADIFALSHDNEYWKTLQQVVQVKEIAPPEQLRKAFARFVKNVHVAMSMVASGEEQTNKVIKNLAMGFGAVYYFFLSNEAQRQTNLFYSRARKETAFEAWNLMEQKLVAQMMSLTLPFIKYANKVYINRVYDSVTLNSTLSALEQGTLNTLAPLPLEKQPDCSRKELIQLMNQNRDIKSLSRMSQNKIPILILAPRNLKVSESSPLKQPMSGSLEDTDTLTKLLEPVKTTSLQLADNEEKVTIKDIRYFSLLNPLLRFLSFENGKDINESPTESPGLLNSDFDGIIVHIHGGGFVSMSSSSHQNYTRQWAKMTGRPIFSIDYRLAPEHMYPAGLDDCWQAYNWIINEVPRIYGINPKKIILSGDSAGGNLAAALTILAIKNGIRVPDGLLLPYPALKLDVKCFSPSMILAIDDQMVPYSILKLCMEVYVPKEARPDKDPLLSPVYASDEILSKFPPTRIMIGDRDPLHDDSWRLVDKLRKLNRDVLMIVYKEMTHGFLGFDVPMGMTETHVCVEEAANLMKELFEKD